MGLFGIAIEIAGQQRAPSVSEGGEQRGELKTQTGFGIVAKRGARGQAVFGSRRTRKRLYEKKEVTKRSEVWQNPLQCPWGTTV